MVLGKGLVASGFQQYKDDASTLIFASGVSNSSETDSNAFSREKDLLHESIIAHQQKIFVYFSTCSIYDPLLKDSLYTMHKLAMETIVKQMHPNYRIFRISNLAGKTDNPHTVLNFFIQHIIANDLFFVWKNASRNIIDIDDAVAICSLIIKNENFSNSIVNVANPINYPVIEIIKTIEEVLGRKGRYTLIDKGSNPDIDTKEIQQFFAGLHIDFDKQYLYRTIKKYFVE